MAAGPSKPRPGGNGRHIASSHIDRLDAVEISDLIPRIKCNLVAEGRKIGIEQATLLVQRAPPQR
jgi:hypothetical protein